jgi:hypothetical protein
VAAVADTPNGLPLYTRNPLDFVGIDALIKIVTI